MYKRYRYVFLTLILASYSLLYLATTKKMICDDDCAKLQSIDSALRANRSYVLYSNWCPRVSQTDSICIWVKDSSGIDWNAFADTVCMVLTARDLPGRVVTVYNTEPSNGITDTLAIKTCN